jgi:SpoVK/Ycf46/Vps4 family AAA+-type ATPase
MRITLKKDLVELVGIKKLEPLGVSKEDIDYRDRLQINLAFSSTDKVKNLREVLGKIPDKRKTALLLKDIDMWLSISENDDKVIKKLKHFESALIVKLMKTPGHRLFAKYYLDSDIWLCYRVVDIRYEKATQYNPENVSVKMLNKRFGLLEESSVVFYNNDISDKKITEILSSKGMYIETNDLRATYLKQIEKFSEIFPSIGKQFLLNGIGTNDILDKEDHEDDGSRNRYRWETRKFQFIDNKAVVDVFREDDSDDDEEKEKNLGELFWENPFRERNKYDEEDSQEPEELSIEGEVEKIVEVPIHPFLTMFDLSRHLRLCVHVNCLTVYTYIENLAEKLVLSEDNKNIIQILIEQKEGDFKDIIPNKTGGAVIILSGKPGVGKTLTAEVFAESKQRPLYNVQASQLGVSPTRLEKQLMKVLRRAARWNAILLIDEADVYIHMRENDINQNAIVGVFLRLLEYSSSILFMTTNRADVIDDAIASRCVARIDYAYPDEQQQMQIWKILAESSGIVLPENIIGNIVQKYPQLSGRDIKNLLKLGNLKAKAEKKPIDLDTIVFVTKFNPTISQEKAN